MARPNFNLLNCIKSLNKFIPTRLNPFQFVLRKLLISLHRSGAPRKFVRGRGGGSTNAVEDRERGSGDGSPLVGGSGGSCNLVQEISFRIVKFS